MTASPESSLSAHLAQQDAFRRAAIHNGWRPIPVTAEKAPAIDGWQVAVADEPALWRWASMRHAIGTGVVLGHAWSNGRTIEYGCRAGDPIGVDIDCDATTDWVIYDAIVARIASYGIPGSLCTVGRADNRTTARVKIMLRAAETFETGAPRAQTRRFVGHGKDISRAVEAYAAGRQFAVSGWNSKAPNGGCWIEIKVGGQTVPHLPQVSSLPALTQAQWIDLLAFIDAGCGLGLAHCAQEKRMTGHGLPDDLPVLLDEKTGKVIDGREAAITRAASKAVGKVFDSKLVPFRAVTDLTAMQRLAEALAYRIVERDIDLERPRDGGSGGTSHWTAEDVAERVGRIFSANAFAYRDERVRSHWTPGGVPVPDPPGVGSLTLEQLADALVRDTAPIVPTDQASDANSVIEAAAVGWADAPWKAMTLPPAAPLYPVPGRTIEYYRHRTRPLAFGLCDVGHISIFYGASGVGKTSVVATLGYAQAAKLLDTDVTGQGHQVFYENQLPGGEGFAAFDDEATHFIISCEGSQVTAPIQRGIERLLAQRAEGNSESLNYLALPRRTLPKVVTESMGPMFQRIFEQNYGIYEWFGEEGHAGCFVLHADALIQSSPDLFPFGLDLIPGSKTDKSFLKPEHQYFRLVVDRIADFLSAGDPIPAGTARPVMMVIDNLISITSDAQDSKSIKDTFSALRGIAAKRNAGVVMIHHTTKDGKDAAGSATINRFADTIVEVTKHPFERERRLFFLHKYRGEVTLPHNYGSAIFKYEKMNPNTQVIMEGGCWKKASFRKLIQENTPGGVYYSGFSMFAREWIEADLICGLDGVFKKGKLVAEEEASLRKFMIARTGGVGFRPETAAPAIAPDASAIWATAPASSAAPTLAAALAAPARSASNGWPLHPDQTSPMTVGPEAFFDEPIAPPPEAPLVEVTPMEIHHEPEPPPAPAGIRMPGLPHLRVVQHDFTSPTPPPAPRVPVPQTEREARAVANAAVNERLAAAARQIAVLMPAARTATGIHWVDRERKPKGPVKPKAPVVKPAPDMSPLPMSKWVADQIAAGTFERVKDRVRRLGREQHDVIKAVAMKNIADMEHAALTNRRETWPTHFGGAAVDYEVVFANAPVLDTTKLGPPRAAAVPPSYSQIRKMAIDTQDDDIPF